MSFIGLSQKFLPMFTRPTLTIFIVLRHGDFWPEKLSARLLHEYFFAGIKEKFAGFSGNSDLGFVIGLFTAIFLLVVPVHKDLLSILLVFSIAISLLILLTVIYVKDPPEFSVFPYITTCCDLISIGFECCFNSFDSFGR